MTMISIDKIPTNSQFTLIVIAVIEIFLFRA